MTTLCVGGIALAQTPPPQPPPDASAGLARQVTLTPKEMVAKAKEHMGQMGAGRTTVRRMLEEARAARDVVKVLCLNDKLNQIDVAIRSAKERSEALEGAANRNDSDLSNHEFTILTVLKQRHDQLLGEANSCIGKDIVLDDKSSVTPSIDPGIPDEEPYPDGRVVVQVPGCTSCFN